MIHEMHFEIECPIKFKGETFDGLIEGYAYVNEDKDYGADRDGNRGQRTLFLEEIEFGNISIEIDDKTKFIHAVEIENDKDVKERIWEEIFPRLT